MTTPKSRLAYKMHFDMLDLAMADPKGIRVRQLDSGVAWRLRLELHHARSIDRDDNRVAYEEGHNLHGCSIYDQLLITIDTDSENQVWLYLHKRDTANFQIESLSEMAEVAQAEEAEIESVDETEPKMEYDFKAHPKELEEATEVERRF